MKILLTGATGYIGRRLLPVLALAGHEVCCLVRNKGRLETEAGLADKLSVVEADLLDPESLESIPKDIDVAYYLAHSMSHGGDDFRDLERRSATNFVEALKNTSCGQIIYLGGIVNDEGLSEHLSSRMRVESLLADSGIPITVLRAAIIIGSGSASFEIIRDLVEKLPVMVAPKWLNTRCQPIAVRNVIRYLAGCAGNKETFGKTFDIGGPDILTYKQMLLLFGEVRSLKRHILTLPVLTPRLSSLWLVFVTSTSIPLARTLVDSMCNEVVVKNGGLERIVPQKLIGYKEAVRLAFERIQQNEVISSWTDSFVSGRALPGWLDFVKVPQYGCLSDRKERFFQGDPEAVFDRVWTIGGKTGWYRMDLLWRVRGLMDKMVGGPGLRRGRRSQTDLKPGDALDFWRVIVADKEARRLLLFAEMKVPGEAWLEFRVVPKDDGFLFTQTATFRPKGLLGRAYWYSLVPLHFLIFGAMRDCIVNPALNQKCNT
ncbi:epimerase [Fulvitalea axinellae]|uniref:Epimerase n=1 Tax=Fulvitalea axinellae TaxID=1182444 RepID=A0AAU9CM55_9BACT|nr:epimerase [Fulvitalea axinellae]